MTNMKDNFIKGKVEVEMKRLYEISKIFDFPMSLFIIPKIPKNIKEILEKEKEKRRRLELKDYILNKIRKLTKKYKIKDKNINKIIYDAAKFYYKEKTNFNSFDEILDYYKVKDKVKYKSFLLDFFNSKKYSKTFKVKKIKK